MKKFNIIIATDNNYGIGLNNNIPWKFNLDTNYFKKLTTQSSFYPDLVKNIVIMGYKTWESLNCRLLNNRICYIITKSHYQNNINNDIKFFPDFYSAYQETINSHSDVWVIGGSQIYDIALKHWACDKIYWTQINGIFNTDTIFNINNYKIKWNKHLILTDKNLLDNKEYNLTFNEGQIIHNIEIKYLKVLYKVLNYGNNRDTRNSQTISKFSKVLSWDLNDGFPLLTTKKMFWRGIVEELLFFISGDTNTNNLYNKGIKIWELNTNKEFLNKVGLNYPAGYMGPMYGYQWRFFNKPYNQEEGGIDQLKKVIEEIKNDPTSRRLMMTDFNPAQVNEGVLYPCHSIIIQFYVENNKLSCNMYQRSGDLFLGIPFNIASTSLLLHIIAQLTNLKPGIVNLILGDYHIYNDHIESVNEQLKRIPYNLPQLKMTLFNDLIEVEKSTFDDYKIINYQSHNTIKASMIA